MVVILVKLGTNQVKVTHILLITDLNSNCLVNGFYMYFIIIMLLPFLASLETSIYAI